MNKYEAADMLAMLKKEDSDMKLKRSATCCFIDVYGYHMYIQESVSGNVVGVLKGEAYEIIGDDRELREFIRC